MRHDPGRMVWRWHSTGHGGRRPRNLNLCSGRSVSSARHGRYLLPNERFNEYPDVQLHSHGSGYGLCGAQATSESLTGQTATFDQPWRWFASRDQLGSEQEPMQS